MTSWIRILCAAAVLLFVLSAGSAFAQNIIYGALRASLDTGSLVGTQFPVRYSYDASQVTPAGQAYVTLNSFDFTLLGVPFTRGDIFQGGQVIFQDGVAQNVTASFQVRMPPGSPVRNITFGFGTALGIAYIDLNGEFGSGSFSFQPAGFTVANRGGASLTSSGAGSSVSVGYAQIQPNSGSTTPSGVAILDFRQNNTLVSEVSVPATLPLLSGRIYAEIAGAVDAGLAVANPNSSPATISFYFTDANGNPAGSGSTTVPAHQQIAQFLDQSPFKVYTTAAFQGTFSFTSSAPVAVVALRAVTNERGDFLMSTLPVIDTAAAPNNGTTVVPHFADGGGWTTQIILVNPTDNPMAGTIEWMNAAGAAATVTIGGQTNSSFPYSIAKRTSQKLSTSGLASTTASGSIRIVPTGGGSGPAPLIVFSYKLAGITLSEAGVPVTSGSAFRTYVESSGTAGQAENIQSGIAVANTSSVAASVIFDVTDLSGAPVSGISLFSVTLAGSGQTAKFLSEIFPSLPNPFKGILRITTTSGGLSVVGLRTRTNERGDFLFTTTPPANENNSAPSMPMFFPQLADGGGYATQFILFSGTTGQTAAGTLQLVKQDGSFLGVALK